MPSDDNTLKTSSQGESPDMNVEGLVGTVLDGKYQLISVLGHGGMGAVYKARHKIINRLAAVKVLLRQHLFDEVAKKRFLQEASSQALLNHENLVSAYDAGLTAEGQPYFVMELVDGVSLEDELQTNKTLDMGKFIEIFSQTARALSYAHSKGVIHRDIKPGNIMLVKVGYGDVLVKIVDFGIAKVLPAPNEDAGQKLTHTGIIFGSPVYMSPEQCEGKKLDKRTDLYSLGCVMYESLAGQPPLRGDSIPLTLMKHISEVPEPIKKVNKKAKVPQQIEEAIFQCLEKLPERRFESADELLEVLRSHGKGQKPASPKVAATSAPGKSAAKSQEKSATRDESKSSPKSREKAPAKEKSSAKGQEKAAPKDDAKEIRATEKQQSATPARSKQEARGSDAVKKKVARVTPLAAEEEPVKPAPADEAREQAHASRSPKPAQETPPAPAAAQDKIELKEAPEQKSETQQMPMGARIDPHTGTIIAEEETLVMPEANDPSRIRTAQQSPPPTYLQPPPPPPPAPKRNAGFSASGVDLVKIVFVAFFAIGMYPLQRPQHLVIRVYADAQDPGSWQHLVAQYIFGPWNALASDLGMQWVLYIGVLIILVKLLDKFLPSKKGL